MGNREGDSVETDQKLVREGHRPNLWRNMIVSSTSPVLLRISLVATQSLGLDMENVDRIAEGGDLAGKL